MTLLVLAAILSSGAWNFPGARSKPASPPATLSTPPPLTKREQAIQYKLAAEAALREAERLSAAALALPRREGHEPPPPATISPTATLPSIDSSVTIDRSATSESSQAIIGDGGGGGAAFGSSPGDGDSEEDVELSTSYDTGDVGDLDEMLSDASMRVVWAELGLPEKQYPLPLLLEPEGAEAVCSEVFGLDTFVVRSVEISSCGVLFRGSLRRDAPRVSRVVQQRLADRPLLSSQLRFFLIADPTPVSAAKLEVRAAPGSMRHPTIACHTSGTTRTLT